MLSQIATLVHEVTTIVYAGRLCWLHYQLMILLQQISNKEMAHGKQCQVQSEDNKMDDLV